MKLAPSHIYVRNVSIDLKTPTNPTKQMMTFMIQVVLLNSTSSYKRIMQHSSEAVRATLQRAILSKLWGIWERWL